MLGACAARKGAVSNGEEQFFRSLNELPESLFSPIWIVMQAGSLGAVGVAAGLAAKAGRTRQAVGVGLSGVAVWAGCKALKPLVGRGRPADLLTGAKVRGRPQTGLGYPSGHAAVAANLAVVLAGGSTALARLGLAAVAGIVAFGRVYTGAHLPWDAVGGLAIGAAAGTTVSRALSAR